MGAADMEQGVPDKSNDRAILHQLHGMWWHILGFTQTYARGFGFTRMRQDKLGRSTPLDQVGFAPRHVSELIKRTRQWLERRGHSLHCVWVAELQKRGALHYHVQLAHMA
jgi:hypothetical protein